MLEISCILLAGAHRQLPVVLAQSLRTSLPPCHSEPGNYSGNLSVIVRYFLVIGAGQPWMDSERVQVCCFPLR